jgi:NADH-quinone oxidoreductase subunit L
MTGVYNWLWLIPVLPLASFVIIATVTLENKRTSAYLGITAAIGADVVSLLVLFAQLQKHFVNYHLFENSFITLGQTGDFPAKIGLLTDPLAAMMCVVVCSVSALIQIYSLEYMRKEEGFVRFFAFISLFTFSMLALVLSNNFFQTYVTWELVGVCSYFLIGHYFSKPSAAAAAKKAFIVTRFGDFPFLVGVAYIFARFHTFNFSELAPLYTAGKVGSVGLFIMAMLVFSGAVGKSAQFPLHVWLPDAMEGPTPISALIHAATMVAAGVYLVARAFDLFAASPAALAVVATIGAATSLMAAIWAVAQDDIKRIIAYSTLSHLGLMMFGLGVGAYSAAIFHLFTHAWFKALLFLCAGSVIHAVHTQDIWEMGGLWRKMRITAWTMLIGSMAAAGLPPLAGFWSKDAIIGGVFQQGNPVFILMAVLITFFSGLYTFRLFFVVFGGKPAKRRAFDPKRIHESAGAMTLPLVILAVPAALVGFWGSPLAGNRGFGEFVSFGRPVAEELNSAALVVSVVVSLGAAVVAAMFYLEGTKRFAATDVNRRFPWAYAWAHNKGWFDEIYEAMFVRGLLLNAGRGAQWFDKNVIDFFFDGLAEGYAVIARALRRLQTGRVQQYAVGLFVGVTLIALVVVVVGGGGHLATLGVGR